MTQPDTAQGKGEKGLTRKKETIESLLKKLGPCFALYRSLTDYGVFDWTKHKGPHIDHVYMLGYGRTAIVALKMALRKTGKGDK